MWTAERADKQEGKNLTEGFDGRAALEEIAQITDPLRRTARAAELYSLAAGRVARARARRDQALFSIVKLDGMRPSDVERKTGVLASMTNYATSRAAVDPKKHIEQPEETIKVAVGELDEWEGISDDAEKLRDDGVRELIRDDWSPQDVAFLLKVTASRVSQIAGPSPRRPAPRISLRLATMPQLGEEIRRRAKLLRAMGEESGNDLEHVASVVEGIGGGPQ
jgi:hypothetical protein